jgi:hypothetical protein
MIPPGTAPILLDRYTLRPGNLSRRLVRAFAECDRVNATLVPALRTMVAARNVIADVALLQNRAQLSRHVDLFGGTSDGSNWSAYCSMGKRNTPRILIPLGARRGDSRDQLRRDGTATALRPAIEDRLHFRGVPGHDDVGEQAQGIGDRRRLKLGINETTMSGLVRRQ